MSLDEADLEILRNEANASPARYQEWDQNRQFRQEYERLHRNDLTYEQTTHQPEPGAGTSVAGTQGPGSHVDGTTAGDRSRTKEEEEAPLSRLSSSSSSSSNSSNTPRLEEIRTATAARPGMASSQASSRNILHLHPTERNPEAIRRIETHRSQHQGTVGLADVESRITRTLTRRKTQKPLPSLGAGKPFPPNLPDREEYVVEFDGVDDPMHPQNWPLKKKLYLGAILSFDALSATIGSSIFSSALRDIARIYKVAPVVATLGTSLFVYGYAFGPLLWAPMSELYGRKLPIIISAFGFAIFSIAVATGKDLQTILICRFFAGIFGSAPLTLVAGVFADIFDNEHRGLAIAVFSGCVFCGPLLSPCIGGFIVDSYLGWRWTEYISSFMGFASFVLLLFFMEETYPPVVLINKAAELRRRTKNWGIHAKQEEIEVDFKELIVRNLSRPMRILFTEPIVLLITIYMSFVYGILYLFLTAYALVFEGKYGWNAGQSGLAYFGLVVGEMIAFVAIVLDNPRYAKKLKAFHNIPVPEWRLPIAIVGGALFAGGLFWFGWTGYTGKIPFIVPILSGLFTGFGIFSIFLSLMNYIVDAYLMFAASAIAANTFMRSIFGGTFPLFATFMFDGMGIEWASTLLGCVALVLVPMPILFLFYGKKIRAKSKFAPAPDIAFEKTQAMDEEAKIDSGSEGADGGQNGMLDPEKQEQNEKKSKEQ